MTLINGGELVARSLADRGIERVYGLHGGHIERIFNALPKYDIELITTRGERAAAYMAHAHYQVTGEPTAALATAGPGVTNALTAVANAYSTQVPMVLIGGCASVKQFERLALQGDIEPVDIFDSTTTWAGTVFEAERIPEYIDLAFRKAERPRPGPAFVNIPMDVQTEHLPKEFVEDRVPRYQGESTTSRLQPDPRDIDQAVSALEEAERPLVITGVGVLNANAAEPTRRFVEQVGVPYLDTAESRGVLPGTHPQNVNAARSKAVGEADLIFLIGKRLDFTLGYGSDVFFNPDATLVRIDADPSEIGRNRPADISVIGYEDAILEQLHTHLETVTLEKFDEGWAKSLQEKDRASRERVEQQMYVDDEPINPWRLCAELRDRLEEDAYVACDGGDILSFGRIALDVNELGHWFTPGPFGCLGASVPFTISASLLEPEKQVVGLIGDGSFGFDAIEIDTAARYGADVTYVIANNAAWNIDRSNQEEWEEHVIGTELQDSRYDKIAEFAGGFGARVERVDELGAALDEALAFDGPSVVDVAVDEDVPSPDYRQGMHGREDKENSLSLHLLHQWDEEERQRRERYFD